MPDDRADGDDPAAALLEHRPHRRLRERKRRGEVCGEHSIPLVALHPQQELIARNAGVAHDDVEPTVTVDDVVRHTRERGGVGHVEAQRLGSRAARRQLRHRIPRVVAARGGDHRRALVSKLVRNRAPDASRSTGHQRDASRKTKHVA